MGNYDEYEQEANLFNDYEADYSDDAQNQQQQGETDYTYEEEPIVEVTVDYEYPEQESDYEQVETLPADKYSDNEYEEPPKVVKSEELAPSVPEPAPAPEPVQEAA